jgi:hypothetical protein
MRVNGRTFPATSHELHNARRLRRTVGNFLPYPEFLPTLFPHEDIVYHLLLTLCRRNICCYLTGGFVYYLAVIFNSYRAMCLYVVLTDHGLLDILFQRTEIMYTLFYIDDFRFQLTEEEETDMVHYRVSW